jgi:hypothetical protein
LWHRRAYPSGVSATVMSWSPMTFCKYPGLCHFVNAGQCDSASVPIRDVLVRGFNFWIWRVYLTAVCEKIQGHLGTILGTRHVGSWKTDTREWAAAGHRGDQQTSL